MKKKFPTPTEIARFKKEFDLLSKLKDIDVVSPVDLIDTSEGFASGDSVLLYTDGITEAEDSDSKMFEEKKLAEVYKKVGMDSPEKIRDAVTSVIEGYTVDDDETLLILKKK